MKPASELVDTDKVFEVVVSAAYRVNATTESEAISLVKESVSAKAWSRVKHLSAELVDENRPPDLPSGMDRWREAFVRLEVGRRARRGPMAIAIEDGDHRWWTNGEVLLLADSALPMLESQYRPEILERLSEPRHAVTFGQAFKSRGWDFPSYVRSDENLRLSAADVYLELVEASVPCVRWFCSIAEERDRAGVADRILMGVDGDGSVVAIIAPCHYVPLAVVDAARMHAACIHDAEPPK